MFKKKSFIWIIILSSAAVCLIITVLFVCSSDCGSIKVAATDMQTNQVMPNHNGKKFDTNYKLEVKTIKKAVNDTPRMDELWIIYSDGSKERLITPVPFDHQQNALNPVTDIQHLTVSLDRKKIYFDSQLGADCCTVYVYNLSAKTINSVAFGILYGIVTKGENKGALKVYQRIPGTDHFVWEYVLLNDSGKELGKWTPDSNK